MPEYADDKPAMMRAYKSADVGKNGFIEFKEFADFIVLLKYYNELGKPSSGSTWGACLTLSQARCSRR